jgi:hypothetical protein
MRHFLDEIANHHLSAPIRPPEGALIVKPPLGKPFLASLGTTGAWHLREAARVRRRHPLPGHPLPGEIGWRLVRVA